MEYYTGEIEKNKEKKIKEQIKRFKENRSSFLRDMEEIKKYKNVDEKKYNFSIYQLKLSNRGNDYVLDEIDYYLNN